MVAPDKQQQMAALFKRYIIAATLPAGHSSSGWRKLPASWRDRSEADILVNCNSAQFNLLASRDE